MPRWSAVPPLCVRLKFNVVTMNMYDLVHLGESRVVYQILRRIYDQIGDAESELGEYQDITAPTYVHTPASAEEDRLILFYEYLEHHLGNQTRNFVGEVVDPSIHAKQCLRQCLSSLGIWIQRAPLAPACTHFSVVSSTWDSVELAIVIEDDTPAYSIQGYAAATQSVQTTHPVRPFAAEHAIRALVENLVDATDYMFVLEPGGVVLEFTTPATRISIRGNDRRSVGRGHDQLELFVEILDEYDEYELQIKPSHEGFTWMIVDSTGIAGGLIPETTYDARVRLNTTSRWFVQREVASTSALPPRLTPSQTYADLRLVRVEYGIPAIDPPIQDVVVNGVSTGLVGSSDLATDYDTPLEVTVVAYNVNGSSSATITVYPASTQPPPPPASVRLTLAEETRLHIEWDPVTHDPVVGAYVVSYIQVGGAQQERQTASAGLTIRDLVAGSETNIRVKAIPSAGIANHGSWSEEVTFRTTDVTAPEVEIHEVFSTDETSLTVTYDVKDNNTNFESIIEVYAEDSDGARYAVVDGNRITGLRVGRLYDVYVRATDEDGNVGLARSEQHQTRDLSPPTVTMDVATQGTLITVSGHLDDERVPTGGTVEMTIGLGDETKVVTTPGDYVFTFTRPTAAKYTLTMRAADDSGNAVEESRVIELVDESPPAIQVTVEPHSTYVQSQLRVTDDSLSDVPNSNYIDVRAWIGSSSSVLLSDHRKDHSQLASTASVELLTQGHRVTVSSVYDGITAGYLFDGVRYRYGHAWQTDWGDPNPSVKYRF